MLDRLLSTLQQAYSKFDMEEKRTKDRQDNFKEKQGGILF